MTATLDAPPQAYVPAALAASRVGAWEYDVASDRLRCDAAMAALYGLPVDAAERGVPIARFRAAIHPEDLPRHFAQCREAFRDGGMFVIEYRTRPRADDLRWVMVRGRYEADASGRVAVGRGIAIDLTESKRDGYAEGRAHFLAAGPADGVADGTPLDQIADLALQVRALVDRTGGRTGALLRPLVDALLLGIGRRIAARLGEPGGDGPGGRADGGRDRWH